MSTLGRSLLFALTVLVAAATSGLGVWQLTRLADRRARNGASIAQRDLPEIDLNRDRVPADLAFRRVTAVGTYDSARQFVLRGRLLKGTPGVQIITPLLLAGRDSAVLVNRGFVPSPDAGIPPPEIEYLEPGVVHLTGIARRIPNEHDGALLPTPRGYTWARLDRTAMQAELPYPIAPYYVIAGVPPDDPVAHSAEGRLLPFRIDPPSLDDGPHFSYAVQWFMIAAAALGFGVVFVLRGGRADRRAPPIDPVPPGRASPAGSPAGGGDKSRAAPGGR